MGRTDIVVKDRQNKRAVIIEAKWTEKESALNRECDRALEQIERNQYAVMVEHAGFDEMGRLRIAFYKKRCIVKNSMTSCLDG